MTTKVSSSVLSDTGVSTGTYGGSTQIPVIIVDAQGRLTSAANVSFSSFASGTRMAFQQTSAPTGWTKDTTSGLNDSIMRIVTGTASSGGSTAFSTFNGQSSVGATTLSISQIPSHTHTNGAVASSTKTDSPPISGPFAPNYVSTGAQGGGGSHTHTITTAIKYNDFIVASKD